jgi:hypothetical protein
MSIYSSPRSCWRCENVKAPIAGQGLFLIGNKPFALKYPLCAKCILAIAKSETDLKALAAKVEALIPDYEMREDGKIYVLLPEYLHNTKGGAR